jgi:hypothetical protein
VRHSYYCLPTDLMDEGAGPVLAQLRDRSGVDAVTVAAKYHAVRDVYPHNPRRRVASIEPGLWTTPPGPTSDPIAIRASATAEGRDVLAEACRAAAVEAIDVDAWAVMLHNDERAGGGYGAARNCFGDVQPLALCPAHPDVRRFAERVVSQICAFPIHTLRLESLHFHGLEPLGPLAELLIGLCFCDPCIDEAGLVGIDGRAVAAHAAEAIEGMWQGGDVSPPRSDDALVAWCGADAVDYLSSRRSTVTTLAGSLARMAADAGVRLTVIDPTVSSRTYLTGCGPLPDATDRWVSGLDAAAMAGAGITTEVPGYLRDASDLRRVLDGSAAGTAVILRPGPPDNATADDLAGKIRVAEETGCSEVNFYAYGLYRLGALDRVGAAIAGRS